MTRSDDAGAVKGRWFAPGSSRILAVNLDVLAGDLVAVADDGREIDRCPISEAKLSDRIGSIPRRIDFTSRGTFETTDNDGVDRLLAAHHVNGLAGRIHRLERFHPRLLVLVLVVVALGIALYRYALPVLVEVAVYATPPVVPELMSGAALKSLDQTIFEPTELTSEKQAVIERGFKELAAHTERGAEGYELNFRGGGGIGPNAFALPDGSVVLTDELVELAPDDTEMVLGVLAHEIGHVRYEHSLRRLYRAAGVAGLILLIGGDIGGGAEDLLVQGSALLTLSYSRTHEAQADRFSVKLMADAGHDPAALARFFELLLKRFGDVGEMDFLSTHPATPERIREVRRLAGEIEQQGAVKD